MLTKVSIIVITTAPPFVDGKGIVSLQIEARVEAAETLVA